MRWLAQSLRLTRALQASQVWRFISFFLDSDGELGDDTLAIQL